MSQLFEVLCIDILVFAFAKSKKTNKEEVNVKETRTLLLQTPPEEDDWNEFPLYFIVV